MAVFEKEKGGTLPPYECLKLLEVGLVYITVLALDAFSRIITWCSVNSLVHFSYMLGSLGKLPGCQRCHQY